ncbi:regulatory protein RecX [Methylosarcina fibrata]|uniref:regulatory protein RecX n=1 Tax=Methylosarcina fibrata TaxID=105972 RepID=UPI0003811527|nr:regulatory protein RecX [Methylosarcina fibrata]
MSEAGRDIRDHCLRWLAAREHSRKELQQKLAAKGFGRDEALAVIDELADEGFQSDARYAESYARSRIAKGYGPIHIRYELKQAGIDPGREEAFAFDLEQLVRAAAGSWAELLERVYGKKYGRERKMEAREWARRSRFLMQRGFPVEMITELFEHLNIKLS